MSILVIGGDEITSIRAVLSNFGCKKVTHWDARKESINHKDIPQNTDCLVMLTNFLNHNTMKKFRNEAKKKEIEAKKKATAPKKTSATKKSSGKSKSKDDPEQIKMF